MGSIKRLMRSRAVTYAHLAKRIGLSEASIKRIFSRSTLTLSRLDEICQALDTSIQEVTFLSADQSAESAETLSLQQEVALAANANLLACFYLVATGYDSRQVASELGADEKTLRRWFVQLQALGLIDLRTGLRAKARTTSAIKWRKEGPVAKLYARQVRQEFLHSPFTGPIEAFHFRSSELAESSCRVLLRKLDRLAAEFRDLAELDRSLPSRDKRSVGMLLATRPWVFSMFSSLASGSKSDADARGSS